MLALTPLVSCSPPCCPLTQVYYPYLLMNKKRYAGLLWTRPDTHDKMDSKVRTDVRAALPCSLFHLCSCKVAWVWGPEGWLAELDERKNDVCSTFVHGRLGLRRWVITAETVLARHAWTGPTSKLQAASDAQHGDQINTSKHTPSVHIQGIETVRRDNCLLVRNVVTTCLERILIHKDVPGAVSYVKGVIADLLMNKIDLSLLVISKVRQREWCWCWCCGVAGSLLVGYQAYKVVVQLLEPSRNVSSTAVPHTMGTHNASSTIAC